jgi:hypothetical protein
MGGHPSIGQNLYRSSVARLSSVDRAAPVPTAAGSGAGGWVRALGYGAAITAALLTAFLLHALLNDFRFPIGPDGPVYAWRASYAADAGIGEVPGGRPGILAILLAVGGAFSLQPVEAVTLLGPVAAVAVGLAGAAVLEASLGPNLLRAVAAALLTGAFAAYLAGGWLSNIVLTAAFLGALGALAVAGRSWRPVVGAAALLAAGTLTHPLFATVTFLIIAAMVVSLVGDAAAELRTGHRLRDTAAFRITVAAGGGAALGILGLVPTLGATVVPGDTSQDGFFRRHGSSDLLRDRYRERLAGDLTRAAVPFVTGTALAVGGWFARRDSLPGRQYLVRALAAWAAVTVAGIGVLAVTGWGPANRLLVFAFFLPLAAAWGLDEVARRRGGALATLAALAAVGFAVASMYGWYRQAPNVSEGDLLDVRRVGRVVAAIPLETPVVILVETDQPAAAFHVTRMANLVRMGLPPDRLPETRVAVGSPSDFRAGRPTLTGDREHDLVARAYLREAEGLRTEAAIVVLERFNPQAFPEALDLGEEVLPGVAVVGGTPSPTGDVPPGSSEGIGGLHLVVLSGSTVALLMLLGVGWARWALPGLGARAAISLAPAAGLAVIVLVGLLAETLGAGADEPWSLAGMGAVGALGYLLGVRR